jgi:hypothetical protein
MDYEAALPSSASCRMSCGSRETVLAAVAALKRQFYHCEAAGICWPEGQIDWAIAAIRLAINAPISAKI